MVWALALAGFVLSVLLGGFFSGSETGLYTLSRVRLRLRRDQGDPAGVRLARLLEDEPATLLVTLIGTVAADYLATACIGYLVVHAARAAAASGGAPAHNAVSELYITLIVTPFVFVFGEAVPKNWFRRDADRLMYRGSLLLWVASVVIRATGIVQGLGALSAWLIRRFDPRASDRNPFGPRAQIAALLRDALEHTHELQAGVPAVPPHPELIERVLRLSRTQVQQVMIPRWQTIGLPGHATPEQVLSLARRTPYTRLPVFDERGEQVLGVAHILELLDRLHTAGRARFSLAALAQPALYLEGTETVAAAIVRMQRSRQKIAFVRGRSGRIMGLLTLKDLLEEVVGDLRAW
ncbi:MAG TPA: CNNM domain-containing protein [Phycisphaerae bacterium]|jgi:CBS domain containing-hemolysin-like protein